MKLNILILALVLINTSCVNKVHYLDNDYPGLTPKKYAPGIVNIEGRFLQNLTMSPDGKEVLLGETDSELWRYERILRIIVSENDVVTDTPDFVENFKYERFWMIGEPMISPDNKNLYFVADYPPDYWNAKRTENGDWSEPVKMDSLSTDEADWYMSASKNNTLYFTNGRIFKSTEVDGRYNTRTMVEGEFNQLDAGDPCISPNEDYMVFASTREGGYGKADIYVCFKNENDQWSAAYNLGEEINTENWDGAPFISPDEKFIFFSRRDSSGVNASFSDIYWVSMEVVDNIRKEME